MSTNRVWKCKECGNNYDLAVVVPELSVLKGRPLTDEEMDGIFTGEWHVCAKGALMEEVESQRKCLTTYDWKTGPRR